MDSDDDALVAVKGLNCEIVDNFAFKSLLRSHYGWLRFIFPFVKWNKSLQAQARRTILKNIDLIIRKRRFVAIMGPSGAGKTTLINTIVIEPINARQHFSCFRHKEAAYISMLSHLALSFKMT